MNKYHLKYMFEDTKLGLIRNRGSAVASISLLFMALMIIGIVLLVRAYVDDSIQYIESQLAMKVYVEDGYAKDIAEILEKQSYISDVQVETGTQMIEGLTFFFEGKEHLLQAFTDGSMPDAVKFQVADKTLMEEIANQLADVNDITKVIYPQQMAERLASFIHHIELYGTIIIVIFFVLAFMMVYFTFHLAMYQRHSELKVKLFLGINPQIIRGQFLLEGCFLGIIGAVLAICITIFLFYTVFEYVHTVFPFIGQLVMKDLGFVIMVQLLAAIVISVAASYLSTRKLIKNV